MFEKAAEKFKKLAKDLQGIAQETGLDSSGGTSTPLVPQNRIRKQKDVDISPIKKLSFSREDNNKKSEKVIEIEEEVKTVLRGF